MDNDYFAIDAILAENQKIQCTFKVDVPDMGHLGGGADRDIKALTKVPIPMWLAYIMLFSDWADFNIPVPFGSRVRNALKAEPRSVRLSALVGAGGLWYGFGKMIMDMQVLSDRSPQGVILKAKQPNRLNDEQGDGMSKILTETFRGRLTEVIDQAQHFAALGPSGGGSSVEDTAQSFREGLDGTERELFALAQDSAKRTKRWYESNDRARR